MAFDSGAGWSSQRRKPLRPVSKKRERTNVIRKANVLARYGDNPPCFACLPLSLIGITSATTGCDGKATDAHELRSRARVGTEENLTDTDGIWPVSRACHSWLTAHPCEAEDAGLALPSGPVTQPLRQVDPRTGQFPRACP